MSEPKEDGLNGMPEIDDILHRVMKGRVYETDLKRFKQNAPIKTPEIGT